MHHTKTSSEFRNLGICQDTSIFDAVGHRNSDGKAILFISIVVLLVNIGFLTNRAGRNKIPYHKGNYSYPSGRRPRVVRIIPRVVRNFIPTQAIGQESYSYDLVIATMVG